MDQTGKHIGDTITEQISERLCIENFSCPKYANFVGVVCSEQENGKHHITDADRQTHGLCIACFQQWRTPGKPGRKHNPGDQHEMQKIHASHLNGFTHFRHTGITLSIFSSVYKSSTTSHTVKIV